MHYDISRMRLQQSHSLDPMIPYLVLEFILLGKRKIGVREMTQHGQHQRPLHPLRHH